nr:thiamine pyrophosphate-dependent enzyme [Novosphingobium flavum]
MEAPAGELEAPRWHYAVPSSVGPRFHELEAAADVLLRAERPLIIAGGGAIAASEKIVALSNMTGWPVVTTQMGLGIMPSDHENLVGQGGIIGGPAVQKALLEADGLLVVGCRFSSWMWPDGRRGWTHPDRQSVVQVDIDPPVIGRYAPVDHGFVCDSSAFLSSIIAWVGELAIPDRRKWAQELREVRDRHRAALRALSDERTTPIHPAALANAVGSAIGGAGLVIFDGGHTTFWSNDFTPVPGPRTRFHEPGMTHLGFGLPWALAMKRAEPDLPVWCITGDGAFGFTIQELDTARREGLDVLIVVHNNEALGVIQQGQEKAGFSLGTSLAGTDYAAVARGFGCFGEVVTTLDEIPGAIARARASGLPAVLDVRVKFVPHPMLPAFARSSQG